MGKIIQRMQYAVAALLFAAGALTVLVPTSDVLASGLRECDSNAVMHCGVVSEAELVQKYHANQAGNTQAIFSHFGINGEAALMGMTEGRVNGANQVFVGDRLVATDAYTAGRQRIDRRGGVSTPVAGGAAFMRQPSVSFRNPSSSLPALVKLDQHGNFLYAVLKPCGNPVKARPVQQPPKPQPKPVPQPEAPRPVVQPKKPDFEVYKTVRLDGDGQWTEHVETKPGDSVEFRIVIRNTGEVDFERVIVTDVLPEGVQYIDGSQHPAPPADEEGLLFSESGQNIGPLNAGDQAVITFSVQVLEYTEACMKPGLKNVVHVKPDELPQKEDKARITVCKPQEKVVEEEAPTPVVLPVTGPGAALGLFAATSISGVLAHRLIYRRFTGE
ncbi:hypothetical protein BH23PAT1_BH23PAT1_2870 [soil metagenome]